MTYDEIMSALLQAYEAHPEMDVEEIIAQVAREMGASDKSLENIKASSAMLDKFQEKKTALEAAHEEGETTKKWLLTETARMTENRPDEEKAIIADAIVETVNRGVNQSLTEGQNSKEE
jgi:predicted HTH transcriptional regulator